MAAVLNSVLVLVFVVFLNGLAYSNGFQCYTQRCLNCSSENITQWGNGINCTTFNLVEMTWLDDMHISFPPREPGGNNTEYACINMYAEPETGIAGSRPDVIRGCVTAARADVVCDELIQEEVARNRVARCSKCSTELCNSAAHRGPALALLALGVILKMAGTIL